MGTVIRKKRREQDVTLEQLAGKVGVGYVTVQRIETGERSTSPETAKAIARALRVPLRELFVVDQVSYRAIGK